MLLSVIAPESTSMLPVLDTEKGRENAIDAPSVPAFATLMNNCFVLGLRTTLQWTDPSAFGSVLGRNSSPLFRLNICDDCEFQSRCNKLRLNHLLDVIAGREVHVCSTIHEVKLSEPARRLKDNNTYSNPIKFGVCDEISIVNTFGNIERTHWKLLMF